MAGRNLLQSPDEWATRNRAMSDALGTLLTRNLVTRTGRGLDVGCQTGTLIDALSGVTDLSWTGIDPKFDAPSTSTRGFPLLPGWAHELSFPDGHFDALMLANVYEHIEPRLRRPSLREMRRVLVDGGIIVGQVPNPYFPIESHSRLPFMGWLPPRLQKAYWKLSPVDWELDFYSVTVAQLARSARIVGFEVITLRNFNYPPEAIPARMRPLARLMAPPMRLLPWAWQFVLRKPAG